MSKKMFVDRLDNYKIDNLRIMTKPSLQGDVEPTSVKGRNGRL